MNSKKSNYRGDISNINKLIDEGSIEGENGALELFKSHINEVKDLGRFTVKNWGFYWRKDVYKLGEKFKINDPIDFLNALTEEKMVSNKDEREVLDFYFSEIEFNSLENETSAIRIQKLVNEYPYNPEFRHTLGHIYFNQRKYPEAIDQYAFSLSKDKSNVDYKTILYNSYLQYIGVLFEKSEYVTIEKILEDIVSVFKNDPIFNNHLISIKERLKDHILLNNKIVIAENSIKEIVKDETLKSQGRIIEILGFFTAIIAFIFSTISIGKNFNFNEAIIFNVTLGMTLLTFVLLISLLFSPKNVRLLDFRVLILIVFVLSLLIIVVKFGTSLWF